ncbi:DUF349 domain-containing protein [Prolixibacteraceae bacterium JC049]|nr:DUF349 domain-containing protein [Prolixibacteraceae bacterium JC049]
MEPKDLNNSNEELKNQEEMTDSTAEKIEPEVETSEETVEETTVEPVDYSEYSEVELVNALREILDKADIFNYRSHVEDIKNEFYKKHWATINDQKKVFLEAGGAEEEFKPETNPYESDIRKSLQKFRTRKAEFTKQLEAEKEDNLKQKYEVIEAIKNLVNGKESINKTFQEFRDLQDKWREIGPVPQAKLKDLWDTYHHHVENFYDFIKINRELRDLDLKRNMEHKIKLCERAEELLVESNVLKAFQTLQKLHEQWREIGPVPREDKDDLWERFKAATSTINKKHQDFFENRKKDQNQNLEAKTELCVKAEEIATCEPKSHKEWDQKAQELVELQQVWRTIGFAPKKFNTEIYTRFRKACDEFFDRKRKFYSKTKEELVNNLQLKLDLCVQAEALKDSEDWKKTTDELIRIQKRWKEIGPVPRRQSDTIWKRFRAACDAFFDRKKEFYKDVDKKYDENLKLKEELIAEIVAFELGEDEKADLEALKEFQRRWSTIGHVPFRQKDAIQNKYRDAINSKFQDLRIDERNRDMERFKSKIEGLSESNSGNRKIDHERDKYMNKLKQLENDLVLLDNNIGFFANTKNAESLIADVHRRIERTKEQIATLKQKIRLIDKLDDEE